MKQQNLVILTGAGISAESGISTFRDAGGLWETHRFEDLASPQGFARDPALVHRFYNLRRAQLRVVQPNAAHVALATLERAWAARGDFLLVTQNVDDLHERAGSQRLLHMHGELRKLRCAACGEVTPWQDDAGTDTPCPGCARAGAMRPDIVWFGEMPYHMEEIGAAMVQARYLLRYRNIRYSLSCRGLCGGGSAQPAWLCVIRDQPKAGRECSVRSGHRRAGDAGGVGITAPAEHNMKGDSR